MHKLWPLCKSLFFVLSEPWKMWKTSLWGQKAYYAVTTDKMPPSLHRVKLSKLLAIRIPPVCPGRVGDAGGQAAGQVVAAHVAGRNSALHAGK